MVVVVVVELNPVEQRVHENESQYEIYRKHHQSMAVEVKTSG